MKALHNIHVEKVLEKEKKKKHITGKCQENTNPFSSIQTENYES